MAKLFEDQFARRRSSKWFRLLDPAQFADRALVIGAGLVAPLDGRGAHRPTGRDLAAGVL